MADKQVIIDGVDISECIFHSLTTMGYAGYNYCKCFECACECYNDCHYKQLARAEQENKRLLEIINAKPLETVDIDSAFEIEKLKEQLKRKEQECEKFKQTLADIKEIAEIISLPMGTGKRGNRVILAKQILQKISEVI